MNEKQLIAQLMQIGCTEDEAEEIFDFYLSIDCIENLNIIALTKIILKKQQR